MHSYKQLNTHNKQLPEKHQMATIRNNNSLFENKPGARYTIVRDQDRKQLQLNKYLNTCQLYKKINPECKPERSQLIEAMYEQKKVMRTKTCRRKGAKEFNFKKQSASRIISNNKMSHKGIKLEFGSKGSNKRAQESIYQEYSDEE